MVSVRRERCGDLEAIRRVHRVSFPTDAGARLVDLPREATHLPVSLVAEVGGEVVGHVAFSPVSVAWAQPASG